MLFVMVNVCLYLQIFLFWRALKDYFPLMYGFKQNEKSSSTCKMYDMLANIIHITLMYAANSKVQNMHNANVTYFRYFDKF